MDVEQQPHGAGSSGAGPPLLRELLLQQQMETAGAASAEAMDDADDPGEDDAAAMQADDDEDDDDVSAVAGDPLGVGPTWGTVAGDPTSSLGGLGPQLAARLLDEGAAGGAAAAPASASDGDADVRGRRLGGSGAAADADEYEDGMDVLSPGGVAAGEWQPAPAYVRHRSRGQGCIDADPRQRADPDPRQGLRGLLAASRAGDAAEALGPAADAADVAGAGGGAFGASSHPVHKADFAMGGIAVPALGGGMMRVHDGLEYTDEAKFAHEADDGGGDGMLGGGDARGAAAPPTAKAQPTAADERHMAAMFGPG